MKCPGVSSSCRDCFDPVSGYTVRGERRSVANCCRLALAPGPYLPLCPSAHVVRPETSAGSSAAAQRRPRPRREQTGCSSTLCWTPTSSHLLTPSCLHHHDTSDRTFQNKVQEACDNFPELVELPLFSVRTPTLWLLFASPQTINHNKTRDNSHYIFFLS